MKNWKIEIKAQDEASALVYLEMLKSSFRAAVLMKLPMTTTILEDPDKGEKLVCTSPATRWSWLRRG
jgi:hypothetical protein